MFWSRDLLNMLHADLQTGQNLTTFERQDSTAGDLKVYRTHVGGVILQLRFRCKSIHDPSRKTSENVLLPLVNELA